MEKDKRYKGIKSMIITGTITEFGQIFEQVPKSLIAQDIRANNNRITKIINYPEVLTGEEMIMLSELLEIEYKKVFELVYNQYNNRESDKELKKKKNLEKTG
jgi:hypothetical protein